MTSTIPANTKDPLQSSADLSTINRITNKEVESKATTKEPSQTLIQLLSRIRAQIEFYFSPQNLSRDTYLRSLLVYTQYPTGAAPLAVIASFPKLRSLCAIDAPASSAPPPDASLLARSLEGSEIITVSPDYAWIISLYPIPPIVPMGHHRINHHQQPHIPQITRDAGPSLPISDSKSEKEANQASKQQPSSMVKERNTVILRDVPENCPVKTVLAVFTTEKIKPKGARSDIGKTWYITFDSEDDAIAAVSATKDREIDGQPIRARVKSESTRSAEPSRSSTPTKSAAQKLQAVESNHSATMPSTSENLMKNQSSNTAMADNRPHQIAVSNYPHFNHPIMDSHQYVSQHQQMYQPHYGMPLHSPQKVQKRQTPANYTYSHPMQPYLYPAGSLYPMQQSTPYYVHNLTPPDMHPDLVAHQTRENYQLRGSQQGYGMQQIPQGSHYTVNMMNGQYQNHVSMNKLQMNSNLGTTNMYKKVDTNQNASNNINNLSEADNTSNKEILQQRRQKNSTSNRSGGMKSNTSMSSADQASKNNNSAGGGKQRGKNKKNRKNNVGANGNENGRNRKNRVKETIVMNTLNFPELNAKTNLNDEKKENDINAKVQNLNIGATSSAKLTGYAAALRQKKNKSVEVKDELENDVKSEEI